MTVFGLNFKNGKTMKKGEMLSAAIVLATNAHAGQFDRGGVPYVLHPLRVLSFLKENDEELQCMCILHDVVEDTKTTWKDLYDIGMTPRVIQALILLTKVPGQTYEEYVVGLKTSRDAMKVKLCDLRHNSDLRRLKGVSEKDIARMTKYQVLYFELKTCLENEL